MFPISCLPFDAPVTEIETWRKIRGRGHRTGSSRRYAAAEPHNAVPHTLEPHADGRPENPLTLTAPKVVPLSSTAETSRESLANIASAMLVYTTLLYPPARLSGSSEV